MTKPPSQIFEYTLKLINIIIKNDEPQNPPIQEINLQEHLKEDNFWPSTVFDWSIDFFQFWRGDLVGFEDDYHELEQIDIDKIDEENIFSTILSKGISIIRGEDHCYLFVNEGEQSKFKYSVIDPIEDTINQMGSIEKLINSKFFIESKNDSDLIDNENIKQITFICFEEFLLSSIAANQYLTWFVQNTNEYNISCLLGLIVFSKESKIVSPLNLPCKNVDLKINREPKSKDKSCLWDTISFAFN